MIVVRTIKVVVVLLALLAGLPTMAFAHSGHTHTASVTATASGPYPSITATQTKSQAVTPLRSVNPRHTDLAFQKSSSSPNIVLCTAGSCCCQGASSCSAGHCCSLGMNATQAYGVNQREDKSFRLALLGWPYPDLIFGLDRPPKV